MKGIFGILESSATQGTKMSPQLNFFFHRHIYSPWVPCYLSFYSCTTEDDPELHAVLGKDRPCVKAFNEFVQSIQGDPPVLPGASPPDCGSDGYFRPVQRRIDNTYGCRQ